MEAGIHTAPNARCHLGGDFNAEPELEESLFLNGLLDPASGSDLSPLLLGRFAPLKDACRTFTSHRAAVSIPLNAHQEVASGGYVLPETDWNQGSATRGITV